jgi:uncharacterized protein
MAIHGAGGTPGGAGRFFLGLVMCIAGGYLFLSAIRITHGFILGRVFFHVGPAPLTGGLILLPLALGVGMIFWNARNPLGWLLALGSLVALCAGVIASIQFSLAGMSLFELLVILVLLCGGAGLLLASLRAAK